MIGIKDVLHETGDDGAKGQSNDDADREIDNIPSHNEQRGILRPTPECVALFSVIAFLPP